MLEAGVAAPHPSSEPQQISLIKTFNINNLICIAKPPVRFCDCQKEIKWSMFSHNCNWFVIEFF